MSFARFRVLAATAVIVALPLSAQSGGPYSLAEVFTPGAISGGGVFHIAANEGVLGTHNLVYTNTAAGAWAKAEVLGRKVSGPAVAWHPTEGLHLFVVDSTARLSHRVRSPSGAWSAWTTVSAAGYNIRGKPATAVWKGKVFVFYLGGDSNVWYTSGNGETFAGGQRVPGPMKSLASPSATADTARLTVVGVTLSRSGMYQQITGTPGGFGGVGTWNPGGMNQPLGSLIVAPGEETKLLNLASAIQQVDRIAVSEVWGFGGNAFLQTDVFEVYTRASPALARGLANNLTMLVRGNDGKLWIRELVGLQWGGFAEVKPPR
jgi:hypothetical protein